MGYIQKCIDSISFADEIIIVDTGSTDGTPSRIRQWAKHRKAEKNVKILEVGRKFHDVDGDFDFGAAKTFAMNILHWLVPKSPGTIKKTEYIAYCTGLHPNLLVLPRRQNILQ